MADLREVVVPDIGDFTDIPVIEVLVGPGDIVSQDDPIVTLESDKATMEIPAPFAGTVREVKVEVGSAVSEGSALMTLEISGDAEQPAAAESEAAAPQPVTDTESSGAGGEKTKPDRASPPQESAKTDERQTVNVPDIGDFTDIPVIEIHVKPGDRVRVEDPLLTLESDKATMDVPSPAEGVVDKILVEIGDTVSAGSPIVVLAGDQGDAEAGKAEQEPTAAAPNTTSEAARPAPSASRPAQTPAEQTTDGQDLAGPRPSPTAELNVPAAGGTQHATPAVRRFARELGVEIRSVHGTGRKGRILKEDVQRYVKARLAEPAAADTGRSAAAPAAGRHGIEPIPEVDFSRFGEITTEPLSRIKRISGSFLHRSWLNVPHVTHHDEADITDLEAFRQSLKEDAKQHGVRLTMLFFLMKALVGCLRAFPRFNASLSADGQSLILKRYFHIGIAVDTPNGLVVPVVRNVDTKGIYELAAEIGEISARARDGKLKPDEIQGGCMTISSLGGIGGTAFTPIVNAPEVAILGVARAKMTPVWNGSTFEPRLMLPLDLSYDHRVVDGAEAARFVVHYAGLMNDIRKLLL